MKFKIENETIGLTVTIPDHVKLIINIELDQENLRFIMPYNQKQHLQSIESNDELHLTVWCRKTTKILGFIILAGVENTNLSLEFRRIVIQSKGRGFGRQCLQLIKEYCFKNIKFHRLWLDVFEDNLRALNLYKSEGFQVEGYLRDVIKQGNSYRTLTLLSILENEYNEKNE